MGLRWIWGYRLKTIDSLWDGLAMATNLVGRMGGTGVIFTTDLFLDADFADDAEIHSHK